MNSSQSIESEIVAALRRIMRAIELHSRRLRVSHGITGPQLATLQVTKRLGRASASTISRELHLSRSTLTGILDRLESAGYIERTRNENDRRGYIVTLSKDGEALMESAPPLFQDEFRERLARLESWEQTSILATLQRIASMMDADKLPAAPVLDTLVEGPGGETDLEPKSSTVN